MRQPFVLTPIGSQGLSLLMSSYQRLNASDTVRATDPLWGAAPRGLGAWGQLIQRESVELSRSLFAWSEGHEAGRSAPATAAHIGTDPGAWPAGFALLGIRRTGGQVWCSVRALATTQPPAAEAQTGDPRPALLQAMIRAARELGATDISAEAALDPADHPARPSVSLLREAGFEQADILLSYTADAARVLAEPVYLQTGLQEVDPSEVVDWLSTIPAVLPPWPAQAESIARLRFPDVTYLLVASGTAAGYLAVTDPHLQEVYVLQIGVLADLRRQQIAVGGLQELLASHDRIRTLRVPPLVREGDRELRAFLEATGFLPAGLRRAEMVLRLNR